MDQVAHKPEPVASDNAPVVSQNSTPFIVAYIAFVALLVAAFKFPPLLDYPNHYARIWLLSGGISEQPFPQIYSIDWNRTFTNVGIDLLAYWIGPIVGPSLLARSLLFLAIILPPLGAIALHRRLFGHAFYWQIAILYLSWCSTMVGGFLNFQIGLGLALLLACVDERLQAGNPFVLFAWRMFVSLLLTVTHIFSLGFYIALVCGLEFSWSFAIVRSGRALARLAVRLAAVFTACALPAVALFLNTSHLPGVEGAGLQAIWNDSVPALFINIISAISTYAPTVDLSFITVATIVIVFARVGASQSGKQGIHAGLAISASGLLILACISPLHALGTGWISWRFPIMAALVAAVMMCPFAVLNRRQAMWLLVALGIVVFGRTGWIGFNWWHGQKDVAAIESVIASVPPGSAIMPLKREPDPAHMPRNSRYYFWQEDTFRHLPTLAVPLSHAFVPTVFTAIGKQPLRVLPPWSEISVPEGNLLSLSVLICPAVMARDMAYTPYLRDWRNRFDFVLVVNTDTPDRYIGDVVPAGLKLVNDGGFAKLYAIDKNPPAGEPVPAGCPASLTGAE